MKEDENKTERLQLYCDRSFINDVDNYGFSNRIRTRAGAIRVLVRKGLEAVKHETAA